MSPPRDDEHDEDVTWPQRDRRVNAAGLSFTLQMVFTIVGVVVSAYAASWQAQSAQRDAMAELRSDVRDIRTTMQNQKELAAKDSLIWEERFASMKRQADADAELRKALLQRYEQSNTDFQKKMLSR